MNDIPAVALGSLHFLRPAWLLLWPLLLIAIYVWRRSGTQTPWRGLVDAHLLPHLLADQSRRGARWHGWIAPLAASLFCLALAGPSWRELPQAQRGREAGLVIVLDLSDGMRASDPAPSRLQHARYAITDLLRQRRDGQTALVAYAGDAFTVAPLTDDGRTLEALLGALEPDIMPVPGQRLERALTMAATLLDGAGYAGGDVLVLTYRADAADVAAAKALAARGVRVSVLALGSEVGAPVALPQGGFLRDDAGELLLPRRDLGSLGQLVEAGSGRLVTQRGDSRDIAELLALIDDTDGSGRLRDDLSRLRQVDDGPWLVLALLPLALLLIRRVPALLALVLVAGLVPAPAQALDWASLWRRDDQQAWQALQESRYGEAQELAESAALRGAAAYRAGDFTAAASAFTEGATPRDLYNRGTALAQAGELEQALAALDAALAADPQLADARHNRDVVQRAIEQKQQSAPDSSADPSGEAGEQGEQPKQDGEPQESEGSQQPSSKPGEAEGQQGEAAPPGPEDAQAGEDPQQAGKEQQEAMEQALREAEEQSGEAQGAAAPPIDAASAEKQQAAEQWLRRIPDDPGGLLRRKFALEHRRRVMEGEQ